MSEINPSVFAFGESTSLYTREALIALKSWFFDTLKRLRAKALSLLYCL